MRVMSFNFTKVSAEKPEGLKIANIDTKINFEGIEKEKADSTQQELDVLKISFNFNVIYEGEKPSKNAEVILNGTIVAVASKEETKDIFKHWEKKELPMGLKVPLFNLILKKCSVKALQLEEEMNLPFHVPLPQVRAEKKDGKDNKDSKK